MVSNAARKYEQQSEEQTASVPHRVPSQQPTRWTRFERGLMAIGGVISLLLVITLLSTKIAINNRQHDLQDLQAQVTRVKNSNSSDRQEIADLTSQASLKRAAQKYGLSDKNSNVRNINK